MKPRASMRLGKALPKDPDVDGLRRYTFVSKLKTPQDSVCL